MIYQIIENFHYENGVYNMSKKAWAGRFTESNAPLFEKMNQSLGFDIKMFKEDIALNTAYSKELNRIGILLMFGLIIVILFKDVIQLFIK